MPLILAGVLLLGGCGNAVTTQINGMTGVTVDAAGRPVLVAELCGGVVTEVTVAGPNRGETANETRADLAAARPVASSFTLDLASPEPRWTGAPLELPLAPDLHIAYAHAGDTADTQLAQVTFTSTQLAALSPGTVQYGSSEVGDAPQRTATTGFAALACAD